MARRLNSVIPRPGSSAIDRDDRFSECCGRLLRRVVPDPAGEGPVLIPARKLLGVCCRVRVRCAVGVAFQRDGRHGDRGSLGEALLQIVIAGLTLRQTETPAVVVDCDGDVIGIVERPRCARRWRRRSASAAMRSARSAARNHACSADSRAGRARSQNNTGTTSPARPSAAGASGSRPGCRSDSR